MPTPPLRRRNPAVSVRRVQSERKYLTPWGAPPRVPTWKYKYDYTRRTAIIPPLANHPHMIGTSQGVLGRTIIPGARYPMAPSFSEAHFQPLILVAPPLIVGAYPPPRMDFSPPPRMLITEDEILAQERINSFLTGMTATHRPRSLLSYPESHLYESLISQISDVAKDDISIDAPPAEENIYQKLTKDSRENSEWSDSSSSSVEEVSEIVKTVNESDTINKSRSSAEEYANQQQAEVSESSNENARIKIEECKNCSLGKRTKTFQAFEKIGNEESKTLDANETKSNDDENKKCTKKIGKSSILRNSFVSNIHKNYYKTYLKSIFKTKKKNKTNDEIHPTTTVVSVVHINKESGVDEVSVRESVCYKCDGSLSSRSQSEKGSIKNEYKDIRTHPKMPKKSQSLDFTKNIKLQRSCTFASKSKDDLQFRSSTNNVFYQRTPMISCTVELPESLPQQRYFVNRINNDKGVQVTSEDIARSQSCYGNFSTLDPLKPDTSNSNSGIKTCTKCLYHDKKKTTSNDISKNSKANNISKSSSIPIESKSSKDVSPLIVDFDEESTLSENENDNDAAIRIYSSQNLLEKNLKNDMLSTSSSYPDNCSDTTHNRDSLVYVYRTPLKFSDKSSVVSSIKYRDRTYSISSYRKNLKTYNRRGGSSGLGSSESESSYEDDCHDTSTSDGATSSSDKKSSVTFIEPCNKSSYKSSSPSLRPNRGRLCFDYSWSWSNLNELVRKVPSLSSARRKASPSLGSLRLPPNFTGVSPSLTSFKQSGCMV